MDAHEHGFRQGFVAGLKEAYGIEVVRRRRHELRSAVRAVLYVVLAVAMGFGAQRVLAEQIPLESVDRTPFAIGVASILALVGLVFFMPKLAGIQDYADLMTAGRMSHLLSEGLKASVLQEPLTRMRAELEQQYRVGVQAGMQVGTADGYQRGHEDGRKEGFAAGRAEGYQAGAKVGRAEGYNKGFSAGKDAALREHAATEVEKRVGEAFAAGEARGRAQTNQEAYARGERAGYQQGGRDGYARGYADGRSAGGGSSTATAALHGLVVPTTVAEAYAVLACPDGASLAETRSAYRRLLKDYHPDVVAGTKLARDFVEFAEERTKVLNAAYELLKEHHGA